MGYKSGYDELSLVLINKQYYKFSSSSFRLSHNSSYVHIFVLFIDTRQSRSRLPFLEGTEERDPAAADRESSFFLKTSYKSS